MGSCGFIMSEEGAVTSACLPCDKHSRPLRHPCWYWAFQVGQTDELLAFALTDSTSAAYDYGRYS